jgi:hypothetical protein
MKRTTVFFLWFLVVIVVFFIAAFFFRNAEAPAPKFKGPTGTPFVKGPMEQPPTAEKSGM